MFRRFLIWSLVIAASLSTAPLRGGVLFVAVKLPPELRAGLVMAQTRLRASGSKVAWEAPSRFHITLAFAGQLEEERQGPFRERLRAIAAETTPFFIHYRGVGTFPNRRKPGPRVLWARPEGDMKALEALHRRCQTALEESGGPKSDYPFHPHVTLGRVRFIPSLEALNRALASQKDKDFGKQDLRSFFLLRSAGKGEYEVIERFDVKGSLSERSRP